MAPVHPALDQLGFSLLELLIAGVLAALLAMLALPSFMDQLRKSRRADAHDLATQISQAQERHRANNSRFAASIDALAAEGVSATSAGGHYRATISEGTGVGYTFTIRPVSGGRQEADRQCAEFRVVLLRGGLSRSATTPQCWPQ